jgi:hypothetical protein
MNQFASLQRLPEAFRLRKASANDLYALVPIYLMLQDPEHVRVALAEGEGAFCREKGVVCEQYRRFERNVEMRSARQ